MGCSKGGFGKGKPGSTALTRGDDEKKREWAARQARIEAKQAAKLGYKCGKQQCGKQNQIQKEYQKDQLEKVASSSQQRVQKQKVVERRLLKKNKAAVFAHRVYGRAS